MIDSTPERPYRWCNACQMNAANGCRHPLGAHYCPYRQTRERRIPLAWEESERGLI